MSSNRTKPDKTRHIGTQTNDIDTVSEIRRLQEQVKLLTIENEHLRKNIYAVDKFSTALKATIPSTNLNNSNEIVRSVRSKQNNSQTKGTEKKNEASIRGCACKGNCSTKICGCTKRQIPCGQSCKCSNICQNQEHGDKENIENNRLNRTDDAYTPIKRSANATVTKSLLSPDDKEDKNKKKDVTQKKGRHKQNSSKVPKSIDKTKNPDERELSDDCDFNPMKPKRELTRTPVHGNSNTSSYSISNASVIDQFDLREEEKEEEVVVPSELKEAEVNWEEYQSRLIPCSKCKRKFHSSRIKKHESCCKNV